MTRRLRACALALAAFLAGAGDGLAQSPGDTLTRWGLIGTWALDCGQPASGSNGYLSYVRHPGGRVTHERDFGDRRDSNEVQRAQTGRGGALELVVHFAGLGHSRRYTLVMGLDGRIKAIANSRVDGSEVTIRDGRFTANGQEAPWQVRCR